MPDIVAHQKLIGLTAPSGAGKSSIAKQVLDAFPSMRLSVSVTTRSPRAYERHGKEYYFVSKPEFDRLITEDALLEYEEVYPGYYYGTPLSELTDHDSPLLLDIDVKGASHVRTSYGGFFIFISPPSIDTLEQRLLNRGTESTEMLQTRLKRAKIELSYANRFDAIVVNHSLDQAVKKTISLIKSYLKDA
ncbi:MAG: guanylate kinase [Bacteroidetes bacterium]|nr:guanylate kinase [Bacteroidota bacterium]